MKTLIVAKTRQGGGACIGGITLEGRSVRLLPVEAGDERWGLAFQVGEVWEIDGVPPAAVTPPHVEDFLVTRRHRTEDVLDPVPLIEQHMPPVVGRPEVLFEGLARTLPSGALYVSRDAGLPGYSTGFWRPSRPLLRDDRGKRVRYRFGDENGPSLVFVGFQEPPQRIPAGTLVRVSLSHCWRRPEHPEDLPRCFIQLSGWFDRSPPSRRVSAPCPDSAALPEPPAEPEPDWPIEPAWLSGPARAEEVWSAPSSGAVRQQPVPPPSPPPAPPSRAAAPPATLHEARRLLTSVFGYDEFRPLQEHLISAVLEGRDCLGIMPTGSGKSLCYQLPALLLPGLTVVVSPLLALMQDQVDQLTQMGVGAVTLNSMLTYREYVEGARRVRSGEAKLLYVAPETLLRPETLVLLEETGVACLTVDEAHCISEWGHDFRPEYRQLRPIRQRFPRAVCVALTATATPRVQDDIRRSLGIPRESAFVAGFDRPNLFLEVRARENGTAQVLELLAEHPGESGIVYCGTRKDVDALVGALQQRGIAALPYHAGLDDTTRRENQRRFLRDDVQVIVATVAFGMGINKPSVRYVVHHNLPDSLETYYQQVGRAGRDGLASRCLLLFGRSDVATAMHFIQEGAQEERIGRTTRLQGMVRYAEATACRRRILLPYFGDPAPEEPCGACDNCRAEAAGRQRVDVSEDARRFLRAVEQTRQRFGIAHVVDVLRGSSAARVLKWRHDQLEAHGSGRHRPAEQWRLLAGRFIELGLVQVEPEHGTLRLTPAAREVLAGGTVEVLLDEPRPTARTEEPLERDAVLFETLRRWRKARADEAGLPPYVLFSDRSLSEMAYRYPTTREALLLIHGVGEHKARLWGEALLAIIREHVESRRHRPG